MIKDFHVGTAKALPVIMMTAEKRFYWFVNGMRDSNLGKAPKIARTSKGYRTSGDGPLPEEWTQEFLAEACLHYMRGYDTVQTDAPWQPGPPAMFAASFGEIAALEQAIINFKGTKEQERHLITLLRTLAPWSEHLYAWDKVAREDGYVCAGVVG